MPDHPTYLHGEDGRILVGPDELSLVELDATEWTGNPFEVEEHVFGTFKGRGSRVAVPGMDSGRPITATVKASTEDAIRAADSFLKDGLYVFCELREPGMVAGHKGFALVRSVNPRVAANAEMEYQLQMTSSGAWTQGTRAAVVPTP